MNNLRTILIGFMIGGGIGAKMGAFLSTTIAEESISWSFVEWGASIGILAGCIISLVIVLMRNNLNPKKEELRKQEVMVSTVYE